MISRTLPLLFALCLPAIGRADERPDTEPDPGGERTGFVADVIIYGGTSAGVIAGVQIKRMGKTVIIVGPDRHLGGLTAGGLGWTDSGKKSAVGGISRDFYHRVWKHYQDESSWRWQEKSEFGNRNQSPPQPGGDGATMWVFEPHVAEKIFEDYIREEKIPVHRDEWLDRDNGVMVKDNRIVEIKMLSGRTYRGEVFIDATYEGDLMASAGVDYHVGREANSVYDENWNGIQTGVLHHSHWFKNEISPYVVPGDPESGLLPRISAEPPGKKGEGDHRVQAYCYRLCMTNHPENRIPFPKPDGYDPDQYELLLRVIATGRRDFFNKFDPIPNYKTDTNNHGPFSSDNIGMNYDYPDGSYERRAEILKEHETYQKGMLYFLANDPRVPEDVRGPYSKWGLAKDEFTDNGGWPHQIYVREARRMRGNYVMTEHDILDRIETPDSVGMGSYTIDSHNVQRYVKPDGFVQNEGDIGVGTPRPYEIAYGSLVPKREQIQNLLVPVCVSSSHIAFGSIRMEPVFMILGQSSGTAAVMAIEGNLAVQDVPYEQLRDRLLDDGQVLEWTRKGVTSSRKLDGIVVDDDRATLTGKWFPSTSNPPFVDRGYRHDGHETKTTTDGKPKTATFTAALKPGLYDVRVHYSPNTNRGKTVRVTVDHADSSTVRTIDQRKPPAIDGKSVSLGIYQFGETGTVTISNENAGGYVVIDAVQFLPKPN